MTYSPYERCTDCAGKAQPGAVNLLKYVMNRYDYTDSLGIYNCRYISGTSTLSNHSCGIAVDIFIPHDGWGNARPELGNPVVQFLDSVSSTIGLTEQIYNRVRYDASSPRGKAYGGVHPHHDHIHLSITKAKGESLTYEQIVKAGGEEEMSPSEWTRDDWEAFAGFLGGEVTFTDKNNKDRRTFRSMLDGWWPTHRGNALIDHLVEAASSGGISDSDVQEVAQTIRSVVRDELSDLEVNVDAEQIVNQILSKLNLVQSS